eukprot:PLAT756.2.p1 GENE.PLAT756.2~~PLAT756.2.p1  ORF type:complete len:214 (+),score=38.40 PLAT756.2:135-776(+)
MRPRVLSPSSSRSISLHGRLMMAVRMQLASRRRRCARCQWLCRACLSLLTAAPEVSHVQFELPRSSKGKKKARFLKDKPAKSGRVEMLLRREGSFVVVLFHNCIQPTEMIAELAAALLRAFVSGFGAVVVSSKESISAACEEDASAEEVESARAAFLPFEGELQRALDEVAGVEDDDIEAGKASAAAGGGAGGRSAAPPASAKPAGFEESKAE